MMERGLPETLRAVERGIERYIKTFLPATGRGISEEGITRHVLTGLALALHDAANEIEQATQTQGEKP